MNPAVVAPLRTALAATLAAALLVPVPLVLLFLAARRAAGALGHPLSLAAWMLLGLLLAAWALAARPALANFAQRLGLRPASGVWLARLVPPLALLTLWVPGTSLWGVAVCALLVAAAEAASLLGLPLPVSLPVDRVPARLAEQGGRSTLPGNSEGERPPIPSDVFGQYTRRRGPDGRHWLSGSLRVEFAAGQRVAAAHVAFCPPLAGLPTCEAEPVDGPAATVRTTQVLPYGVRFEVKLDAVSRRPVSLVLDFTAVEADARTPLA